MTTRPARTTDAEAVARIYNEGIEDRIATFETEPRTAQDIVRWLDEELPLVVVESDGEVVAWAVAHRYRDREAYAGVGESRSMSRVPRAVAGSAERRCRV